MNGLMDGLMNGLVCLVSCHASYDTFSKARSHQLPGARVQD